MPDQNQNQDAKDFALFNAAGLGQDVATLLDQRANPNSRHGMDRATPLMNALSRGQKKAVAHLLPRSDLSMRDNDGWTALMRAATSCPSAIPALASKIDVLERDSMGRTALMHAARQGNLESLTLLMPLGGFELVSLNGMNAMDFALEKSSGKGFATVRHIKAEAARLGLAIPIKLAVQAEMPRPRPGGGL